MALDAADLAQRLGRTAEAVCREYLSNGHREGRYWLVGDVQNSAGRSMFVRLDGAESGQGAAGKWTEAATGEPGDHLGIISARSGVPGVTQSAREAPRLLRPLSPPHSPAPHNPEPHAP